MFAGDFAASMDEKGRLVLPAMFRTFITAEDREGVFILVKPTRTERCLRIYPATYMKKVKAKILREAGKVEEPEEFLRAVMPQMTYAALDSQSRFLVPPRLVDYAGLGREVLMVGMTEWIEVWDPKEYAAASERSREKYKDKLGRLLWAEGTE
jgi:MraZ protein